MLDKYNYYQYAIAPLTNDSVFAIIYLYDGTSIVVYFVTRYADVDHRTDK